MKLFKILPALIIVLSLLLNWSEIQQNFTHPKPVPVVTDAETNFLTAFNLVQNGTFSSNKPTEPIVPTMYREPGYPILLASWLWLTQEHTKKDLNPRKGELFKYTKICQLLVRVGTCLLVALLAFMTIGRVGGTVVSLAMIEYFVKFTRYQDLFLPEHLSAFLIVAHALTLYIAVKNRSRMKIKLVLAGGVLGALALTKAVFHPYFFLITLALTLLLWSYHFSWKKIIISTLLFSCGYLSVTAPWMIRNSLEFGQFAITSGRGGVVLKIRTATNQMTLQEARAAFINCGWQRLSPKWQERLFPGQDMKSLSFRKYHNNVMKERNQRMEMLSGTPSERFIQISQQMQQEAFTMLREDPLRHLVMTIPLTFCGLNLNYLSTFTPFQNIKFYFLNQLMIILSIMLVLWQAYRAKKFLLVIPYIPMLFSVSFYAFFTHNIARYNFSLIPIFILITVHATLPLAEPYLKKFFQQGMAFYARFISKN